MEQEFIINQQQAQELYDFIRTHLQVVNETPYVEELMIMLEDGFDLNMG